MGTKYEGTEQEEAALNLFIKLSRSYNSVSSRVNSYIAEEGLTVSQFGTLEALYYLGPLFQNELGNKLLKTGGNITMVIDNLEKRKLVKRVRSKKDRRYVEIHLTAKGKKLIENIFPNHVDNIVAEMSVLTIEEQQTLSDLLRKLGKQE